MPRVIVPLGTIIDNGNVLVTIVLLILAAFLIWGITDPKKHAIVLVLVVIVIIVMIFAIIFGKMSVAFSF